MSEAYGTVTLLVALPAAALDLGSPVAPLTPAHHVEVHAYAVATTR